MSFAIVFFRGYKIADQDDLKVPLITSTGNKVWAPGIKKIVKT
jgi:hypothetical protein